MNSESSSNKPPIAAELQKILREIFEKQFRKQFSVFMVLLVIAVMASVLRSVTEGWKPIFSLHVAVLVIITVLSFVGRERKGFFYGGMIIAMIFIVSVGNLIGLGMVGMGLSLMLVTLINVTLFFGKKNGFILTALNLLLIILIGYLYIIEIIPVHENITEYAKSVRGWASKAAGFLLFGFYTVITIDVVQGHLFGLINDIRGKESELRKKDERYNAMLQNIPGVVYHCLNDEYWTMKFISEEIETLSGYAAGEFIDNKIRSFADIIHEEDRLKVSNSVAQALEKDEPFTIEYRIVDRNGIINWVREKGRGSINEEDGEILLDGVILNITDEKTMELTLRESEQKFRTIVEEVMGIVLILSPDYEIMEFNPEAEHVYGYKREEVLGKNYLELCLPPEVRDSVAEAIQGILAGNPVRGFENNVLIADGSLRTVIWNSSPLHDKDNKPIGVIAAGQDITERRQFEERLRESELQYRSLFEGANDAIFIMSDGVFRDCNSKVLSMFGCDRERIIGVSPVLFSPELQPDGRRSEESAREKIAAAMVTGSQRFEWMHRKCDKTEFPAEVSLSRIDIGEKPLLLAIVRDMSESKKAEEALRKSEAFRRRIFDTSRMPIVVMEYDTHKFIDCNPATVEIYGYTNSEEVLGKKPKDVSANVQYDGTPSPEKARFFIEKAKKEGAVVFEWRHQRPDGEIWDAEVHMMSFEADGKELLQFSLQDITDRKRLEADLRDSRANLSAVLESTTDLIWSVDCDFRAVIYNSALTEYLKKMYGTEVKVGSLLADVVPSENAAFWEQNFKRALSDGSFRLEHDIPGTGLCLELSFFTIISEGRKIGIAAFAKDITERKRMEKELRDSEMKYRLFIENVPSVIWLGEKNGQLSFVNSATEREYNYSAADKKKLKTGWLDNVHEEDVTEVWNAYRKMFDEGKKYDIRYRYKSIKGNWRWMQARANLVDDYDGVKRAYGIVFDVSNEVRNEIEIIEANTKLLKANDKLTKQEATIRESEERFRQIANNIEEVFFLLEKNTRSVLYASPAIELLFGVPLEKIIASPLLPADSIHPDDRENCLFADLQKRYSQPINEIFRIVRPDGGIRWLRLRSFLVKNNNHEVYRVAGVIADISESVQAQETTRMHEQQLIQADKMASIGMMVSGVAHEINNPNNLIMLNADVMKTIWQSSAEMLTQYMKKTDIKKIAGLPGDRAINKFGTLIDGISGGAVRIKRIVQNLKDFARIDAGEINESLQINDVIETALQIVFPVIKKATKMFSVEYGENIPDIHGNYQKLEQVFINLITNACQSLENNQNAVGVCTEYLANDKMVKLTVTDEGKGIAPEHLNKIFDPFFTTKRDTGGTGLGMSVSYGIIKEHRGEIHIQSVLDAGTTVTVLLPSNKGRVDIQYKNTEKRPFND